MGDVVVWYLCGNLAHQRTMRYKITIEYDGASFSGWQQQSERITVQGAIENALSTVLRKSLEITGSGRTDAGVHARGQIAHFDAPEPLSVHELQHALNGYLNYKYEGAVVILDISPAHDDFHARYDARKRTYRYFISTEPRALDRRHRWLIHRAPDFNLMNCAAEHLIGEHHFGSFCITQSSTINRTCSVYSAQWHPESRTGDWFFEISANRFVHGMVRAIVGTLINIGLGKRPADILDILRAQNRRAAGPSAPPHGLVLTHIEYQ